MEENTESIGTCEDNEESHSEDDDQGDALYEADLKFPDSRKGEDQDGKVGENCRCRVRTPSADLVYAMTWEIHVPHLLDRYTEENKDKDNRDDPGDNEGTNDIRG